VRRATFRSLLIGGLLALPAVGSAQSVVFEPGSDEPAEHRLAAFLDDDAYVLIARDTILSAGLAEIGSLLVLDASVRISATVAGSVYVVDGDLFLRPGARVEGDVVVLGGGYYASDLAEVAGEVVYLPNDRYSVVSSEDRWTIYPVPVSYTHLTLPTSDLV